LRESINRLTATTTPNLLLQQQQITAVQIKQLPQQPVVAVVFQLCLVVMCSAGLSLLVNSDLPWRTGANDQKMHVTGRKYSCCTACLAC
jgi:hypothetical protein